MKNIKWGVEWEEKRRWEDVGKDRCLTVKALEKLNENTTLEDT